YTRCSRDWSSDVCSSDLGQVCRLGSVPAPSGRRALHHRVPEGRLTVRITMVVVGSRGDVQPFLALGSAMRARGHEVRLATHADFRELAAEADLEFHPVPGSPRHYFESPEVIESLRHRSPALRLLRSLR